MLATLTGFFFESLPRAPGKFSMPSKLKALGDLRETGSTFATTASAKTMTEDIDLPKQNYGTLKNQRKRQLNMPRQHFT